LKTIRKSLIFVSKDKMSKEDVIETILFIINKILDYTSTLQQKTPSIFDIKYIEQEDVNDSASTNTSSNDESFSDISPKSNAEKYTLTDYFYFWVKKFEFGEDLLILTMMNIDKILAKQFILNSDNVKNLLYTCMVVTQKYYEDVIFNDKDYSKIGGYKTEELINMEVEFLELLEFSLHIKEEEFIKYKSKMITLWKDNLSYLSFS
jgi:hypothetical protein